ncbi:nucleotidyltransferase family protein [Halarsenatibacter silvermanii]|uniref:Polymerase beta nucleotidyltransferase domain-containing protein n=1 Tax=Halarsenatibacter silvermanii TaxID=321763 RepID=A0A1G9U7L6_9FIRM|nr:nucleotidyltransferase domain-containing protein [Halarsenatibacter silvermanii]SDM55969.1 hypothetical protein SAMN04488692_1631 [Halarsenatibacter silvermanii]
MKNVIPRDHQDQVDKAVEILKEAGCDEIYVYGSILDKDKESSDIDLAVKGCPPDKFFKVYSELMFALDYPVDLIDLDRDKDFAEYLMSKGKLLNVS